jgi:hypothetical protein
VAEQVKMLPGDTSHLQRLIGDHAPDRGMPPARLQRWLNAMIITAVLDRVRDEGGEPVFLLKGGLAMELRLQLRARRHRRLRRSVQGAGRGSDRPPRRSVGSALE